MRRAGGCKVQSSSAKVFKTLCQRGPPTVVTVTWTRQSKKRSIPPANTRDTRDRMIVNDTNTWLNPENIWNHTTE